MHVNAYTHTHLDTIMHAIRNWPPSPSAPAAL